MKICKVTAQNCMNDSYYNKKRLKCGYSKCKKTVQIGERVFYHSGNGKLVVHMSCMAEYLGNEAEFHDYESDFEKIKKEMLG